MRITKIFILRDAVRDAVGDAPKRVVKSSKRLSETSSSADNQSQEPKLVENQSLARKFDSSDQDSCDKLSKRSSSSENGGTPKKRYREASGMSYS